MRNIIDEAKRQYGAEPICVLYVLWNGQIFKYSDKQIPDANGAILEISNLENVTRLDGSGQSTSLSVKLEDLDGSIRQILNHTDIIRKQALLVQAFADAPDNVFVLYEGEVAPPFEWSEGERIFSFNIITRLQEQIEAGFSPEENTIPGLNVDLIGKPWPMIFGSPLFTNPVPITLYPTGSLTKEIFFHDQTLEVQIARLDIQKRQFEDLLQTFLQGAAAQDPSSSQAIVQLQEEIAKIDKELTELGIELANQEKREAISHVKQELATIYDFSGGGGITRDKSYVKVGDQLMAANIVTDKGGVIVKVNLYPGTLFPNPNPFLTFTESNIPPLPTTQGPIILNPGSQVSYVDFPMTYVCNILPSTNVTVFAYRSYNGARSLCAVPTNLYKVGELGVGKFNCTTITLNRPLSLSSFIINQKYRYLDDFMQTADILTGTTYHILPLGDWEDQLYVNLTSSVGPNTVDIIKWLIQTYTTKQIDSASFDNVKLALTNYPMNFALYERKDVDALIQEIAHQARCAVWIKNNTYYIKYLSSYETPVDTITEDDIIQGSLEVGTTGTEGLITKYVGKYRVHGLAPRENFVIARNNIDKYGYIEYDEDFYAYNNYGLVRKSVTFWMIRLSNVYKTIKFRTPLHKLNLETFDMVEFNFSVPYVSQLPFPALINSVSYDSAAKEIEFEVITPIRIGEDLVYRYYWPSNSDNVPYLLTAYTDVIFSGQFVAFQPVIPIGKPDLPNYGVTWLYTVEEPQPIDSRANDTGDPVSQLQDHTNVYPTQPQVNNLAPVQVEGLSNKYEYHDHQLPSDQASTTGLPGTIVAKTGQDGNYQLYDVNVLKDFTQPPVLVHNVRQLQINKDEEIPKGTGVIVNSINTKANGVQYFMQVPIWL